MNQRFKPLLTLAMLLAVLSTSAQQDGDKHEYKKYEFSHERKITKSYPAAGNTLYIENSFGDIKVSTGGTEIKVDIQIEASSNNKEAAARLFENIDVTDSREGNQVKFKTSTSKDSKGNQYNCKNCNTSMRIHYTVQVPAGTPLVFENSFGDIILPDYSGAVSLTSKFGDLKTGALARADKISSEFGTVDIKDVNNLNSTFKFSTVTISSLGGNSKLNLEFCKASRINLASDLSGLDLKESYSLVSLVPAAGLSASYDIRTSFSTFKNKTSADVKRTDQPDRYGPDADHRYEGKSGAGAVKVDIRSSFGKIILGEATDEEMRKEKAKAKTRVI